MESVFQRLREARRPMKLMVGGLLVISGVSLGFDAIPRANEASPRPGSDMVLALPVPTGARVLERSIDHIRGRSLLAVDLEPSDPPTAQDTMVLLRLEPIAGVLLARMVGGAELPGPASSIEWWTFPHRGDVKVTSHPTTKRAGSTFRVERASENRQAGIRDPWNIRTPEMTDRPESGGSTRVGARVDR